MPSAALAWGRPPFGILFSQSEDARFGYLTLLELETEALEEYARDLSRINGFDSTLSDLFKGDPESQPQWWNPLDKKDGGLEASIRERIQVLSKESRKRLSPKQVSVKAKATMHRICQLYLGKDYDLSEDKRSSYSLLYFPKYDAAGNFVFQGVFAFRGLFDRKHRQLAGCPSRERRAIVTPAIRLFMDQLEAQAAQVRTDLSEYYRHSLLSLANQASHNLGHPVKRAITAEQLSEVLQAVFQRLVHFSAQSDNESFPVPATIYTNENDLLPDFIRHALYASQTESVEKEHTPVKRLYFGVATNEDALKAGFLMAPNGVTGGLVHLRNILENVIRNAFKNALPDQLRRFQRDPLTLRVDLEAKSGANNVDLVVRIYGFTAEEAQQSHVEIQKHMRQRHLFVSRRGVALQEHSRGLADIKNSCAMLISCTPLKALEELSKLNLTPEEVLHITNAALSSYRASERPRLPWGIDMLYAAMQIKSLYIARQQPFPKQLFTICLENRPDYTWSDGHVTHRAGYAFRIPMERAQLGIYCDTKVVRPGCRIFPLRALTEKPPCNLLAFCVKVSKLSSKSIEILDRDVRSRRTLPTLFYIAGRAPENMIDALLRSYAYQLKFHFSRPYKVKVLFQSRFVSKESAAYYTKNLRRAGFQVTVGHFTSIKPDSSTTDTIYVPHDDTHIQECLRMLANPDVRNRCQLYPWVIETHLREAHTIAPDSETMLVILSEFLTSTCMSFTVYHETMYKRLGEGHANVKGNWMPNRDWLSFNRIDFRPPISSKDADQVVDLLSTDTDCLIVHASILQDSLRLKDGGLRVQKAIEKVSHKLIVMSTSGRRTLDPLGIGNPIRLRFLQYDNVERALRRICDEGASKAELYRLCCSATSNT